MPASLLHRSVSEAVGTCLLLIAIVGSGIMAEKLAAGNVALMLLANSIATGAALVALIYTFAPWSGAQFNPAVTVALALDGKLRWPDVAPYIAAQIGGGIIGVWIVHLMFDLPILQLSTRDRSGIGQYAGEFVATFGLLLVIESGRQKFAAALPAAIAAYIVGAYWFTSSTSFANPAVTIARSLTNTFAGIGPAHILGFVLAQIVGGVCAMCLVRWLDAGVRTQGLGSDSG